MFLFNKSGWCSSLQGIGLNLGLNLSFPPSSKSQIIWIGPLSMQPNFWIKKKKKDSKCLIVKSIKVNNESRVATF